MKTLSVTKEGDRCGYHRTAVVLMALVLVSVLLISMAPVSEADTAGECGTELSWTLTENTDVPGTYTLTIGGNGTSMTDYSSVSHPGWYDFNSTITSLVLPTGLTHIGAYAFYNLSALAETNVSQLDSLTSIGEYAFAGTSITSMDLSGTEITSVEEGTFWQCRTLANVELPTTVTAIGIGAFSATGLQSINFEDLYNLSSIDRSAFESSKITTADLSNTDLTTIADGAFHYNDSLTSVTIPPSVTTISGQSFNQCGALTSLIIPEGSSLTSIGESAFSATGLTSVDLSGAAGLTTLGDNAFGDCPSLTQVMVPETFTIPTSAFEGSPVKGIWTASVGDRYFDNLADAFGEAADGETIKLLKSIEIDTYISISDGRDLTLDLGEGNDISSSDRWTIFIIHGGLKIEGRGTISAPMTKVGAIGISGSTDPGATDYSTLEIGNNVTIMGYWGLDVQETASGNGTVYGIVVDIYGHAVGLTDTSTTGYHGGALYVSGNIHGHDGNLPIINIHDSAVITGNYDALGIYGAGQAIWNIDAATISGSTGIEIRNGTINIDGATVTSTVDDYSVMSNGSGRTTTGAAIAITSYYPTEEDTPTMEIVSGTFTGPVSVSQTNPNSITGAMYDISILGGTFTSTGTDPSTGNTYSAVIAENAKEFISGGNYFSGTATADTSLNDEYIDPAYKVENGTVVVDYESSVAKVGDRYFSDFLSALREAANGDVNTIELVNDCSLDTAVVVGNDQYIKIDLAGNKLTMSMTSDVGITIKGDGAGLEFTDSVGDGSVHFNDTQYHFFVAYGTLELDGVTVESETDRNSPIMIQVGSDNYAYESHLTVTEGTDLVYTGDSVTTETTTGMTFVAVYNDAASAVVDFAGNISADEPAKINGGLYVWGMLDGSPVAPTVNVTGGDIDAGNGLAIYGAGFANYNITGGHLKGSTAVEIRAGNVSVSGDATLEATGEFFVQPNGNGNTTTGVALAISQHTTNNAIDADISGGVFIGDRSFYQATTDEDNVSDIIDVAITGGTFKGAVGAEDITEFITGGTFDTDVTPYMPEGMGIVTNPDGSVTVTAPVRFDVDSITVYSDSFRLPVTIAQEATVVYQMPEGFSIEGDLVTISDSVSEGTYKITATSTVAGVEYTATLSVTVEDMGIASEEPGVELIIVSSAESMGEFMERYNEMVGVPDAVSLDSVWMVIDVSRVDCKADPVTFSITLPWQIEANSAYYVAHFGATVDYPECVIEGDRIIITPSSFSTFAIVQYQVSDVPDQDPGWNPGWDDDDDYVPPIYVPGDTSSSSDDETVKIVACAAAAVVAAIMAAFLILGHRRE